MCLRIRCGKTAKTKALTAATVTEQRQHGPAACVSISTSLHCMHCQSFGTPIDAVSSRCLICIEAFNCKFPIHLGWSGRGRRKRGKKGGVCPPVCKGGSCCWQLLVLTGGGSNTKAKEKLHSGCQRGRERGKRYLLCCFALFA